MGQNPQTPSGGLGRRHRSLHPAVIWGTKVRVGVTVRGPTLLIPASWDRLNRIHRYPVRSKGPGQVNLRVRRSPPQCSRTRPETPGHHIPT
jgi:hypothetical protein